MSATAKGVPSSGRDLRQVDASVLCGYATLIIRFVCIIIYIPRFTRRDKDRLFALEKPADWSYDFFTSEKRRIDVLIGYIIIFTCEQNRILARGSSWLTNSTFLRV